MKQKRCFKCGRKRLFKFFYKHPMMADGHLGKCKDCNKRDVQENYAKRRKQYSDYDQKRHQTPKRKKYVLNRQKLYRKANPEKYRARNITHAAIRDGKLIRQPCERQPCDKKHKRITRTTQNRWTLTGITENITDKP